MSETAPASALSSSPPWQALVAHEAQMRGGHLRDLFAEDPERGTRLTAEGAGLLLDYSKHRVSDETLRLLLELAAERDVTGRRDAMFAGERINTTEDRAVLHVALRAPRSERIMVDGMDAVAEVHAVLDRMSAFSDQVRNGTWLGHTGKRIRNVVSIG
ncbi:MAG: glucose-6-phosphate isomerase, partial [Gammaproteobacteria bacterium]